MLSVTLPFGKHRGLALEDVPSGYLQWLTTIKLSSGLRHAVGGELSRRGIEKGPPPPSAPASRYLCRHCPEAAPRFLWQEDRGGNRRVRVQCGGCHAFLSFAPLVEPFIGHANATASPAPALAVLIGAEELNVRLRSDGRSTWVHAGDWRRATPGLLNLLRQCNHQLARLLGKTPLEAL